MLWLQVSFPLHVPLHDVSRKSTWPTLTRNISTIAGSMIFWTLQAYWKSNNKTVLKTLRNTLLQKGSWIVWTFGECSKRRKDILELKSLTRTFLFVKSKNDPFKVCLTAKRKVSYIHCSDPHCLSDQEDPDAQWCCRGFLQAYYQCILAWRGSKVFTSKWMMSSSPVVVR